MKKRATTTTSEKLTKKSKIVEKEDDDDLKEEELEDIFDVEEDFPEEDGNEAEDQGEEDDESEGEDGADDMEGEEEEQTILTKKQKKAANVPEGMKGGLAIYQINEDEEDDDDTALELQALLASRGPMKVPDEINEVGLLQKLDDIRMGGGKIEVPWVERLDITALEPISIDNINDDLKRELAFYNQALNAAAYGRQQLTELNIPHQRPDDYFAEMIKSDAHMSKIRIHMLKQKQQIEEAEARRKNRDMKKYGKQVQREKQQERQKKKKSDLETIKKWRKDREQGVGSDSFPLDKKKGGSNNKSNNNNNNNNPNNKNAAGKKGGPNPRANQKREYRNQKYGFGGKKRGSKENTKESFYGLDRGNKSSGIGKGKKSSNRPGKRTRERGRK